MAYQIVWTQSAQQGLAQLVEYIASDDPIAAERFGLAIIEHVEQVSHHPKSGRVVPEFQITKLRELIFSPYRLIYEVGDEDDCIYVVRIWHAARGKPSLD
ncbi:MAG: type II toxin-antitoxin system RelE/ParE family toxin [Puniceicoccales bacterium]